MILSISEVASFVAAHRDAGRRVAFTNGVFDLLHPGHVRYLREARSLGDVLIVGVNSDASVRRNKGPQRPINPQDERAEVLAALGSVDFVVIFDESDPHKVIAALQPDVLVKGGDWPVEKIIGRDIVEARGGTVISVPYIEGASTTGIIEKIVKTCGKGGKVRVSEVKKMRS